MNEKLADAYRVKLCIPDLEAEVLKNAEEFHRMGFHYGNLSPSQMAAVAQRLARASLPDEAVAGLKEFIESQLRKLEKKRAADGRVTSWLVPFGAVGKAGLVCLGSRLCSWAVEAAGTKASGVPEAARLSLMRRFWSVLQAHCRHHRAFNDSIPGKGEVER